MRPLFLVVLTLLLCTGCSRVKPTDGPLQINTPSDWTVKYQLNQGKDFYFVIEEQEKFQIVFFFAPSFNPDRMGLDVDSYIESYMSRAAKDPTFKLADGTTPTKGEFTGSSFRGNYVEFDLADGTKSYFFLMTDGTGAWEGQFHGSSDGWNAALEILKSIKKK